MRLPYASDLWDLVRGHACRVCHTPLVDGEELLCLSCLADLPRLDGWAHDNEAEHRVFGRMTYEHGAAYAYYNRTSAYSGLLQAAKYAGQPWVDTQLARAFAHELTPYGWPWDVDVVVPVPIHWWRRLRRGHNQAEAVARGVASVWHLPVETACLYKRRYTRSQVGLSYHERLGHIAGTFGVRHAERVRSRHVLVVDDVLTSGATLTAVAEALTSAGCEHISFLTLGLSI